MEFTEFDGYEAASIARDWSGGTRKFVRLARWWKTWGKPLIVGLLVLLGVLWWQALQPPTYSKGDVETIVAYAVNNIK